MKIITLVAFALLLAGCASEPEDNRSAYERVREMLLGLEAYQAEASVEYISNRGSNVYDTLQLATADGRYRVEILAPENLAGNITLFDGQTITQLNPRVSGRLVVGVRENPERSEIFLTSFIRNYLNSQETAVSVGSFGQSNLTVLDAVVPGNHPYLATSRLWIDNDTLSPTRMVIYDRDDTERVIISYTSFTPNPTISDDMFTP